MQRQTKHAYRINFLRMRNFPAKPGDDVPVRFMGESADKYAINHICINLYKLFAPWDLKVNFKFRFQYIQ